MPQTNNEIPVREDIPDIVRRIVCFDEKLPRPDRSEMLRRMVPPPNSICLAAGAKSGTTWTQQILHGLRSGGDLGYEDIDEEVVNLVYSPHLVDVCAPQRFQPNMYKLHRRFEHCVKGFSKYIVVTRDPVDAAVSAYYHACGWFFAKEELSLDDFVDDFVARRVDEEFNASQIRHQASWYPHRKDSNVLWLHYEDLKEDLRACVKLISDFTGIGVGDQALLDLVERQASFGFMKAHESKYNEHVLKLTRNEAIGLPRMAGLTGEATTKVRNGGAKKGKDVLSPEMAAAVERRWRSILGPISPYDSYAEMRTGINKELGRPFGRH